MSVFIASQDTRTDFMLTAMPNTHFPGHSHAGGPDTSDVVETRLWMEEHNWLYGLLRSSDNVAPTFRIPDLLSACVAIIFSRDDERWDTDAIRDAHRAAAIVVVLSVRDREERVEAGDAPLALFASKIWFDSLKQ